MEDQLGALGLVLNAVVLWNTTYLDTTVDELLAQGYEVRDDDVVRSVHIIEHALLSERTIDGLTAARARGRTGGQKPKLDPRQVQLARQMYEETGDDGKRRYTVVQIAAEFSVTCPTIYRHLTKAL